jgi:hypothetical protein
MKYTLLLSFLISMPLGSAIKPYEPVPVRNECTQQTFDRACVPVIKKAEVDRVRWI